APVFGPWEHLVYVRPGAGPITDNGNLYSGASDLVPGTAYRYRATPCNVTSCKAGGDPDLTYSDPVTAPSPPPPQPGPPPFDGARSQTQITLGWGAATNSPGTPAANYLVVDRTDSNGVSNPRKFLLDPSAIRFTDEGLAPDTVYRYVIYRCNYS